MHKKRWLLLLSVVLISVVVLWRWLPKEPVPVWLVTVEQGVVEATVSNTRAGTVKACRRSRLSMPIGGVVDRLLVKKGDKVDSGQLLLELWNKDREAEVVQAQQLVTSAINESQNACLMADLRQREAKRIESLRSKKLASIENLDTAQTAAQSQQRLCDAARGQVGVAEARLQLAQAILDRSRLHAPFAGIVAEINGEVGEYITPSPPGIPTPAAVDLIDYSCLYVSAPIDEIDASNLRLDMPAVITLDAFRNRELQGRVRRIAPYVLDLERQARTVEVEVQLETLPEDIALLVGYSADLLLIEARHENVLRIPSEALLPDNSVWLVDEQQRLQRRAVSKGLSNWTYTEIVSGLKEGERIVRSPDEPGLQEGAAVREQTDSLEQR
ncbi:efflux RND transporter periplasmic adaptor subunit [Spongiibacter sp. KMU-158]|uniref:Efflux RND transporter periplasmic adaptor subunit n=1 Tax=Spongiibacter pelagi TaxID=2760804 RepID=A0A927C4V2_9GAMM|nr:efflux RND transporter periplasmic adaptor subunit [Spongiibacter pelagi]